MTARPPARLLVHASTVALGEAGVLIRGASGSGKSDLALRLIDGGARLIADDQTLVFRRGGALVARLPEGVPKDTVGRLEVRGVGILRVPRRASARLVLAVQLASGPLERSPEPRVCRYLGLTLPLIRLDPKEASAAAKVRLAARWRRRSIMPPP